jgi:lambda family phage tail tape measure protein
MADVKYSVGLDTKQAERSLDSFQNRVLGLGAALAGAFTLKELVNVSTTFQDFRTSLGILYKDVDRAGAVFEDIKTFAQNSVFSVRDLTETVLKLKSAGLEPSIKQLKLFADTSSVAADQVGALQAITDLYSRTVQGGLGLVELQRLEDRAIPAFSILSEKLQLARKDISEFGRTAEGAAIILQALEEGFTERFGGASEKRAKNLSQAMSNLGDAIDGAFDLIGLSGFNEALTNLIKTFTIFIEQNQEAIKALGQGLGKAIELVTENLDLLGKAALAFFTYFAVSRIVALAKGFILLSKAIVATPIGRIAALAALAVGAFVDLDGAAEETTKQLEKLDKEGKKLEGLPLDSPKKGIDDLKSAVDKLNPTLEKARKLLADEITKGLERVQDQANDIELNGLFGLERALKEIEQQEKATLKAAQARLREELKDEKYKQKLDEQLKQLEENSEQITAKRKEQAEKQYELERDGVESFRRAMEEYAINASNTAETVRKVFETAVQGMEDAIVRFVKTGKFSFRSLINDLLEQLLRARIQDLFGMVFGGLSGRMRAFAGSKAGGGLIGANQYGIAGEAGPELVMGPASVTPLRGGNVTYNINAVDARSFQELVASDPEFMFAVTEQGRKTVPEFRR